MREEHERNLNELGEKFNDERQRQMDLINDKLDNRKVEQADYR